MGATLGYFLISLSLPNEIKIPYSFGLIYLPALFGSLIGSLIFSKIGVKVAQKINENILTKMLGILFLFLGTFMISKTNFFWWVKIKVEAKNKNFPRDFSKNFWRILVENCNF